MSLFHLYRSDSDILVWLSVDPLADKYSSMSSYMYTAGNPVMLVDPDGRKIRPIGTDADEIVKTKSRKYGQILGIVWDSEKNIYGIHPKIVYNNYKDLKRAIKKSGKKYSKKEITPLSAAMIRDSGSSLILLMPYPSLTCPIKGTCISTLAVGYIGTVISAMAGFILRSSSKPLSLYISIGIFLSNVSVASLMLNKATALSIELRTLLGPLTINHWLGPIVAISIPIEYLRILHHLADLLDWGFKVA